LREKLPVVVPVDCGHVANCQRRLAFMIDVEARANEFQHDVPVFEGAAPKHASEIKAQDTLNDFGRWSWLDYGCKMGAQFVKHDQMCLMALHKLQCVAAAHVIFGRVLGQVKARIESKRWVREIWSKGNDAVFFNVINFDGEVWIGKETSCIVHNKGTAGSDATVNPRQE
jgi:hypothetical protein